jgi:hypothetical protein
MGDANISDFKIKTHIEKQQKLFMTPHNHERKETKKKLQYQYILLLADMKLS